MEGKAVLFKRFADVDAIDIELASEDPQTIINCVALMEPSFGGINLEDIRAPECFIIEQALRERMKIPVFHDDQHGTAVIAAAALINALYLTDRKPEDIRLVINGAGAAAIACCELVKAIGVPAPQVILCDSKGVLYRGRTEGMNQWKSAHAVETEHRTLADAIAGADVFFGLSVKGAMSPSMVRAMNARPIIFAMANPDPEILPEEVKAIRDDAIIATGRSDYPNQVNNVLGFPYIFRGALDVQATTINDSMKVAAAEALAELARQDVPDEVVVAYGGTRQSFGLEYIIPTPFDPRLMETIPLAVAKAATTSGVARAPIGDERVYQQKLRSRLNPTMAALASVARAVRANPKRMIFSEGEEDLVIRSAASYRDASYGTPILVGDGEIIRGRMRDIGVDPKDIEFHDCRHSLYVSELAERLYLRLQRKGYLARDCRRMINENHNIFSALLLDVGYADAMITGTTRHFRQSMLDVKLVIDSAGGKVPAGIHIIVAGTKTIFIADTTVHERPSSSELARIATQTANVARSMGHEPRVAFLSYSNFGNPRGRWLENIRGAISLLDEQAANFEYEGEMTPDVAINPLMRRVYPFNRLTGPANILVMPGLQSANIVSKLIKELGGSTVIGPLLVGMAKPIQIAAMTANTADLTTLAMLTAAGLAS